MTPAISEHDFLMFNAVFDMLAAVNDGAKLEAAVDNIPEDQHGELFIYTLAVAYAAIEHACTYLNVTVDEFLAERDSVTAMMRGAQ